jgi:hypothetical protein
VHAFIREAEPIGPRRFPAEYLHLFAFTSDDWAGEWWHSLRWTPLHAWLLGMSVATAGMLGAEGRTAP